MGIDSNIQSDLLRRWASEAYNNESAEELAAPCVWLDDYLIRFMQLPTEQRYTLDELFQHFWEPIQYGLIRPSRDDTRLRVYGVVCDNRPLVTKFKQRTQTKRTDQAKAAEERKAQDAPEPYPDGWCIDPEHGVVTYTDGSIEKVIDPLIDLRRLRVSRGRDARLWFAFHPLIEKAMADAPVGRLFFFDFDGSARWFGKSSDSLVLDEREQRMGEADPALVLWSHRLAGKKFPATKRWRSSDSDLIPLSLLHQQLHANSSGQRLIWHRAKDERVDLTAAAWYIARRMVRAPGDQLTPLSAVKLRGDELAWFAFFCAAAGCDFVYKSDWVKRTGVEAVLEAVRLMARLVREKRETWHSSHEMWLFFVRLFYTERWMERCGRTHVPARYAKPPTREWHTPMSLDALDNYLSDLPSELDLEIAGRRVDFCLLYWAGASQGVRPDLVDTQMWPRVDRLEKKRKAEASEDEQQMKRSKTETESNELSCTPPMEDIQE